MKWRVDAQFDSDVSVSILDENDFEICEIDPFDGEWTAEHIHKARLIAAAPELLEALKIAHAVLTNQGGGDGRNSEQVSAAERAIAKAEGRQ